MESERNRPARDNAKWSEIVMTISDYQNKLWNIVRKIYDLERDTGYLKDNHVTALEFDHSAPSQCFDEVQANRVMNALESCTRRAAYSLSPIQHEGTITMNDWEQYELDGIVLDCGSRFEVLLYDSENERNQYVLTTIECDNEGYYLTYNGQREVEGLQARMR